MSKENNFYKQIFKATSYFGSSQALQFVFQVFSNKIIATLLGPVGIGTLGFINNIVQALITLTSFDLSKTATREMALLSTHDKEKLNQTLQRHFEFALIVSIFSSCISVIFAKQLSLFGLNDESKAFWFYLLPIYFLFFLLTQTRLSILQGLRETKTFAFLQVLQVVLVGLSSILFYYFYALDGIIWALLAASVIHFMLSFIFTQKYFASFEWRFKSLFETFKDAKSMLYFGFVLSINAIVGQLCFLGIRAFLKTQENGIELIGFYEVSQVVLIKYLGMVFIAMAYDYYPKLTSLIEDKKSSNQLVNQQIEIAITFVLPAVILLYAFGPWVISVLYTKDFMGSFDILLFGLMALGLKAFTYPLGFVTLAHGDKSLFFKQEFFSDLLNIILSISLFYYFGLIGLGMAMFINYLFYGIFVYYHVSKKYDFKFEPINIRLLFFLIFFCLISVIIIHFDFNRFYIILLFFTTLLLSINKIYNKLKK
jgi:O-antigen/teichoic acid export membrane protein